MRREDVKVGRCYATDRGQKIKVLDTQPGWVIRDGDHVLDPQMATRFVKDKGNVPYQTNIAVKAQDAKGNPVVVEPRRLTEPWEDFASRQKENKARRGDAVDNAQALTKRAKKVGLDAIATDPERERVTVSFEDFDRLLRGLKV